MPALIFPAPGPVGNNNAQWTDTANSFTGFSVTESLASTPGKAFIKLQNPLPKTIDQKVFRPEKMSKSFSAVNALPKSKEEQSLKFGKVKNSTDVKNPLPKTFESRVFDVNYFAPVEFQSSTNQVFTINTRLGKATSNIIVRNALPKIVDQNLFRTNLVRKNPIAADSLPKAFQSKVFDVNYITVPLLKTNYTQVFFLKPNLGKINQGVSLKNALPKGNDLKALRIGVIGSFRQGADITEEVLRPPFAKALEQRVFDVEKIKQLDVLKATFPKQLDSRAFDVNYIVSRFIVNSSTTQVFSINTRIGKLRSVLNVQNPLPKDLDRKVFRVVGKAYKALVISNPLPKVLDSRAFDPGVIQPFKANSSTAQVFSLNTKVTLLKKDYTSLRPALPKDLDRKAFSIIGKTFKGLVVVNGLPNTLQSKIFDVTTLTKNTISVRPAFSKTLDQKVFDPGVTFTRFKDTTFQDFSLRTKVTYLRRAVVVTTPLSKALLVKVQRPGGINKPLFTFRAVPEIDLRRKVTVLRPSIRVVGSHQTNYRLANVSSNVSQNTVVTTTAPTNARQNFYYFTIAPGKRQDTARAIWSKDPLEVFSNVIIKVGASSNVTASFPNTSFASNRTQVFSLITKIAIISSNVGQNTVSTILTPTNARENFYYFTLAPGKRQDTARDIFSKQALGLINVPPTRIVANISSNVRQNTVVTTTAPTNARENFYYFTIAPGKRQDTARDIFSKPATGLVINSQKIGIITSNVRQNTVVTTTAPTNARENLYYFTIAPGKRQDTARAIWSKDPLQTALRKEIEQKVAGSVNRGKLVVRTPLRSRVYFEAQNVTSNISQSNVSTTIYPTNPREYLYYATRAPGLYGNKDYFKQVPGGLNESFFDINTVKPPGLVVKSAFPKALESKVFNATIIKVVPLAANSVQTHVFSLRTNVAQLNKAYISLRNPLSKTYEAKVLNTDKLTVSIVVKGSLPKVLEQKVFDVELINPFKLKVADNQVFTLSTIVDNFKTTSVLRNTYSKTFDQKQFKGNYVSKEVKVASVFSKQLDSKVFDTETFTFKFKDATFQLFSLNTTVEQIVKPIVSLRNPLPKHLETKVFQVPSKGFRIETTYYVKRDPVQFWN
jgi:hypothetical protein